MVSRASAALIVVAVQAMACVAPTDPVIRPAYSAATTRGYAMERLEEISPNGAAQPTGVNARLEVVGWARGDEVGAPGGGVMWSRDGALTQLPGGQPFTPVAVNDAGMIVGNLVVPSDRWTPHAAVADRSGYVTDLGVLAGDAWSQAIGVNNRGEVIGTSGTGDGVHMRGFVWSASAGFRELEGLPGADQTQPWAINNRGQVVGYSSNPLHGIQAVMWDRPGAAVVIPQVAAAGDEHTISEAFDLNDAGDVVGAMGEPGTNQWRPFILGRSGLLRTFDMASWANGAVYDAGFTKINGRGDVVGWYFGYDGTGAVPIVLSAGSIQALPVPEGMFGSAAALAQDGTVVGFVSPKASMVVHPVRWSARR